MSGWRPWSPGEPLVPNRGRSSLSAPSFPGVEASERLAKLAQANDAEGMTALLNSGVSPDVVLWSTSTSLLAHCLGNKRFEAAQALVNAGADPCFPLTHFDEFMLEPSVSGDMASRLRDIQTALGRAARARRWEWVSTFLDLVSLSPSQDPTVRELVAKDVSMVGVSMVNRNAPPQKLLHWMGEMDRLGLEVNHGELFEAMVSKASPSRSVFDLVLARYRESRASSTPTPSGSPAWDAAPELCSLVDSTLKELVAFEFTPGGLVSGPPKGVALGWLIQAWKEDAKAHSGRWPQVLEQVEAWSKNAARLGYARLLEGPLLAFFPPRESSKRVLDALVKSVLASNHHTKPVLGVLEKHWGKSAVVQAFHRVDADVGTAWRIWLSRPALPEGPNTLIMAKALLEAGVKVPQRSDRSFLEDAFSTGANVTTRFKGPHGVELVKVLVAAGADPTQPNLRNELPEEVLAGVPDPKGDLDGVKAALEAMRLDRCLVPAAPSQSRSPRF